jgi:hypothetical protein
MKISLFKISTRLSEIDKEFHKSIESLLPILNKIDSTKVSEESGLAYNEKNVYISIISKDYAHASLDIFIARDQLIVGFAGSVQYEDHHTNRIEQYLLNIIEKYLSGIRINEYCTKNGKVLKRKYFYRDNSVIGTASFYPFFFFGQKHKKEISISFFSA